MQFFSFKIPNDSREHTWYIPVTTVENTDSLTFSSNWSTVNVQGSTEAFSAYNYTNNPTIPIQLKFHEDLWSEYSTFFPENYKETYLTTIAKLASLQYPGGSSTIEAPYVIISFNGFTFRGYFTNLRITQYGPLRNGYRVACEISGQFTIVKKSSPNRSGVASSFRQYFQ